jgi:DNA-directed RNA polymerase specialized sigma24 family protein
MDNERRNLEDFSLEALRAGDKAEFARLVETYSGVIYRLAVKMLQDSQDAEDVLQETFLKAYRYLSSFDGRSSLSTWLYRIATNEALMLLRKRKHITVSLDEPAEADDYDQRARSSTGAVPEEDDVQRGASTLIRLGRCRTPRWPCCAISKACRRVRLATLNPARWL